MHFQYVLTLASIFGKSTEFMLVIRNLWASQAANSPWKLRWIWKIIMTHRDSINIMCVTTAPIQIFRNFTIFLYKAFHKFQSHQTSIQVVLDVFLHECLPQHTIFSSSIESSLRLHMVIVVGTWDQHGLHIDRWCVPQMKCILHQHTY